VSTYDGNSAAIARAATASGVDITQSVEILLITGDRIDTAIRKNPDNSNSPNLSRTSTSSHLPGLILSLKTAHSRDQRTPKRNVAPVTPFGLKGYFEESTIVSLRWRDQPLHLDEKLSVGPHLR